MKTGAEPSAALPLFFLCHLTIQQWVVKGREGEWWQHSTLDSGAVKAVVSGRPHVDQLVELGAHGT